MKIIVIIRFIWFLSRNEILVSFVKNYKRGFTAPRYLNLIDYLIKTDPFNYVYNAFSWDRTEEGFMFWDDIDEKWSQQ